MTDQESVLQTLLYSDVFNFPLTIEELWLRSPKKISKKRVEETLLELEKKGKIGKSSGFWFIKGRSEIVKLRKRRRKSSKRKLKVAGKYARTLSAIPSIRAVFATGSLAAENAEGDEDIDLMIVTSGSWLWTTRLFITPLLDAIGIRRRPGEDEAENKLCLNLYLETSNLALPKSMHSLYSAYELIQAKPLVDKDNVAESLLSSNSWVSGYLPNVKVGSSKRKSSPSINPLEKLAFTLQKKYMSGKVTNETVSLTQAFFHPIKRKNIIESEMKKREKKYKVKSK